MGREGLLEFVTFEVYRRLHLSIDQINVETCA